MVNVSAQDFRNTYENFYDAMRMYLWPYSVLKELAQVELDIYDAFIDVEKLSNDFSRLQASIRDVCKDDDRLGDSCNDLLELINLEEPNFYARLGQVAEVDPEKDKQIRTIPEEEDKEEELA